ncbi:MAG: hypothetical protein WCK00_02945 [Deltaproteobacteria bacterium]
MITRINNAAPCTREWTLNERVNGNVFGRVRKRESPLRMRLYWKRDDEATRQLVGAYELNLHALKTAGYVRELNNNQGEVFLRFQSAGKSIQIATKRMKRKASEPLPLDIGVI